MGKRQRFPHLIVQPKRPSTTKLHNTTQDASAMSTKGIADVFFWIYASQSKTKNLFCRSRSLMEATRPLAPRCFQV